MAACVHKREFVLWKYFSNRDMSLYLIKIWMVASCVQTHADGKHNNNNNSKKKKYFINPPFFVCLFWKRLVLYWCLVPREYFRSIRDYCTHKYVTTTLYCYVFLCWLFFECLFVVVTRISLVSVIFQFIIITCIYFLTTQLREVLFCWFAQWP